MPHLPVTRRQFFAISGAATLASASTGAWAYRQPAAPRVAMIGCGRRGLRHLRHLMRSQAEVTAVCDIAAEVLSRTAEVSGGAAVPHWEALLDLPLDGVVLAAPDDVRQEMLQAFLAQGTHVFCETPWNLQHTLTEGVCLGAPLHAPHALAWSEVPRIVEQGALGKLRWSQVHLRAQQKPTRENWVRQFAEGVLPVAALHAGEMPENVSIFGAAAGESQVPAAYSCAIHFACGHVLNIHCTEANPAGQHPVIRSESATLELRGRELHLFSEGKAPEILSASAASPLETWLSQISARQPDLQFARALVQAESWADQALASWS